MTTENLFTNAKQSLVLKPKTNATQAFIYRSISDLENLIGFIGNTPKVNVDKGKMILSFGKITLSDNSVIFRNSYGEVTKVLTLSEANEQYEIVASSDFKAEHKNKVIEKPKVTRTKK